MLCPCPVIRIREPPSYSTECILLGKTMDSTVEVTMASIEPKLVKRRILATTNTTPTTDVLHRATLMTMAQVPVYNHVFMALPIEPRQTESLFSEILRFLWTKQVDGHTKQKRRLVVKKRISAGRTRHTTSE
jgi:hypothetical protein